MISFKNWTKASMPQNENKTEKREMRRKQWYRPHASRQYNLQSLPSSSKKVRKYSRPQWTTASTSVSQVIHLYRWINNAAQTNLARNENKPHGVNWQSRINPVWNGKLEQHCAHEQEKNFHALQQTCRYSELICILHGLMILHRVIVCMPLSNMTPWVLSPAL